ncbi:Uncharacterised protein [uncultured archaeon]|nr:Uncharacterised protein [uncultured archaeon]
MKVKLDQSSGLEWAGGERPISEEELKARGAKPLFLNDPKYGTMIRKEQADREKVQEFQEGFKEAGIKPTNASTNIMKGSESLASQIRGLDINAPEEIKRSKGGQLVGLGKESAARMVEFGGVIPVTVDIVGFTAAKNPAMLPGMAAYGAGQAAEGMVQEATMNTAQFGMDLLFSAGVVKGIKTVTGKVGTIPAKKGAPPIEEFNIATGSQSFFPRNSGRAAEPPIKEPFNIVTGGGATSQQLVSASKAKISIGVAAAATALSTPPARATPTENQAKAYETAKEYSEGKNEVTSITPPSSPSRVHLNVAQEGAIEFNRGLAAELGKTIDNVKVDRKGRVVRKPQGFDVQATDEVLVESDYFNKVKEESRPEVRHRKDISIGDEEPGILTYRPEEIPKGGGKNTLLPSREELFGKAPNIEEFQIKPSKKRLMPRANLRKAYLDKVVSDAEWRDYETWKEAGRMDVIDRKYPTLEPKPVTEADIGYDLKKAVHKKIVHDAEWMREERKLNQQNQIPKDMRKLGMGYLVEAKVRPRRRGTRAILQKPLEPEYGAYSKIAIPLPLERELVVEAPQEIVAIAKQRPVAVAVQRKQQAQNTKQTPSLMTPLQTAQIEIPAWEQAQREIAIQARVQKQTQKYAQVSDQVPDLLSVTPPAQKQRSGSKQVSIEKQVQKQTQKQRTVQQLRLRPRTTTGSKKQPKPPSMRKVFGTVRIAPIWEPGAPPARKGKHRKKARWEM